MLHRVAGKPGTKYPHKYHQHCLGNSTTRHLPEVSSSEVKRNWTGHKTHLRYLVHLTDILSHYANRRHPLEKRASKRHSGIDSGIERCLAASTVLSGLCLCHLESKPYDAFVKGLKAFSNTEQHHFFNHPAKPVRIPVKDRRMHG